MRKAAIFLAAICFVSGLWLLFSKPVEQSRQQTEPSPKGRIAEPARVAGPDAIPPPTVIAATSALAAINPQSTPGANSGPASVVSTNSPAWSEPAKISQTALEQILALEAEKASRSSLEIKLDSQLLFASKMERNEPITSKVMTLNVELDRDEADRVLLDLKANVSDDLLGQIVKLGGEVLNQFPQHQAVRAAMPLAQVMALAERSDMFFVAPAARAVCNAGSVNSEGDIAERANVARATFNVSGAGVKVGVLSDSVDFLAQSQASGDLGNVTVLPGQSGVPASGEGTAMLEIVHDLAPGAELYYATAFGGQANFAENIRQLRAAGCDIIIDDVGYFSESPFQDGIIAQAVNEVTANGTLFFSSAGNSGNKNDNQSGVWEGDFNDGGQIAAPLTGQGRIHNFGPANYNEVVNGGSSRRVDLFWADPLGNASNDYDLYMLDAAGANVVSTSNNTQNGFQDPYETINKLDVGQRIVVVRYSGAARFLHLSTGRGRLGISTGGQVRGHNSAVNAFCVAAVSAANATTPFTAAAKVETFTSDGLRRIFFNADGTAITPGNFSSTGGTVRQKPDIAAADGVKTTLPGDSGLNPFYGTSAAAPHAGAIAALLKSARPGLNTAEARAALIGGTLDIEAAGVDRDAGHGLVMTDLVIQAAAQNQPPTITEFAPGDGPVGSVVTITGTKFDGAINVKFNGVSSIFTVNASTEISATVPVGATTGKISVTTPDGTATSANNFVVSAAPVITGFTPQSGNIGTIVTLNGANFTGATTVSFGGVAATLYTVNSAIQITATVPVGAVTGKISVTTPTGTAQSAGVFTVTTAPVITVFTPTIGPVGTIVNISGANFANVTAVSFGGVSTDVFTVNSAASITVTVPIGAASGPISVTTGNGTAQSAANFTVVAVPAITTINPAAGVAGTVVKIKGTGLGGATAVTFNGLNAAFTLDSPTQITATAPPNVSTGPIRVSTPGGTATSATAFSVVAAPGNDNFAAAQTVTGSAGSVSGNNSSATKEAGEPSHAGNAGGKSVWYRWTAPGNGTWTFDTIGSAFDTLLAVYVGSAVGNLAPVAQNDDIVNGVNTNSRVAFLAFAGTTYMVAVDGFSSGPQSPNPVASGAVTLNWAPTVSAPAVTGFTPALGSIGTSVKINGANFTGVTDVRFNSVAAAFTVDTAAQITATVPAGAASGPISVTSPAGTATSAAAFNVITTADNDNFANAFALTGNAGTTICNNEAATKEAGEPAHGGNAGGKSVWFAWTAPSSGLWTFDTTGSSFDTLLGIYTGPNVANLTAVASNDDWIGVKTSQATVNATAGTAYRIAVDGYAGASGTVILTWKASPGVPLISNFTPANGAIGSSVVISGLNFAGTIGVKFNGVGAPLFSVDSSTQVTATVPAGASTGPITLTTTNGVGLSATSFVVANGAPGNDNFAQRAVLTGSVNTVAGSNRNATREAGEPQHAGNVGGGSVWWTWTAPATGSYRVTTLGSDFDTLLAVYTGTSLAALSQVAYNDDGPHISTASVVSFNAVAGTSYQIAVDGFNGASGNVVLTVYPATSERSLYSTAFEPTDGYSTAAPLSGQAGWLEHGPGQSGVVSSFFPNGGQQAYLGFSSTIAGAISFLWQPLNYTPDTNTRPVVAFSTRMEIVDSSNFLYDDFGWAVFNRNGEELFVLDFDNSNLNVYYRLNDGSGYHSTGHTFQNRQICALQVTMDFGRNLWSAKLDGVQLVENLPLSATNTVSRTLGDIDARWAQTSGDSGDNYMVFDDYSVTAGPSLMPRIITAPASQTLALGGNARFLVVVDSPLEVSYQWRFNGVDIPGETLPTLTLNNLAANQAGAYTVLVKNAAAEITSSPATLTVTQPSNLTPYKPAGWSDKIVAATIPGTTVDSIALSSDQDVYVSWAVINNAVGANITSRFYTQFFLDGVVNHTWFSDGLNAGSYVSQTGYNLGKLTAGTHTLRIDTDATAAISEVDEFDNSYTKSIVVSASNSTPPQLISASLDQSRAFQFSFSGIPSRSYEIQGSTNLANWTVLATVVNSNANGIVQFKDSAATNFSRRFYRVRLVIP